jgi:transcriptional regulator with XRE-family HTH domain
MLRQVGKGSDMTGAQIKELRKSLGYTQARLAEEVGLTPNTIARYERDELKPSPPVLKLLRLLELSQGLNKAGRKAA